VCICARIDATLGRCFAGVSGWGAGLVDTIQVLLSEHDEVIREVLLECFAEEGWATVACAGLADINAALAEYPSAVVVSDSWRVEFGETISPQYAQEIRTLAERVPLLLLHSWCSAQRSSEEELGATVLPKPFDLTVLIDTIKRLAGRGSPSPAGTR